MDYTELNAKTIDRWVEEGWEWGRPVSSEAVAEARRGNWSVLLTPNRPVPAEWFPDLKGRRVLGLAAGGGQQMPIFAVLGADCTVLDYSEAQLQSEQMVSAREGYESSIVRADMTKPLPFPNERFDLIFHPVSNCYVADVLPIWKECFRILKPGGVLLAGLDNGLNFVFDEETETIFKYVLPFDPLRDPALMAEMEAAGDGVQFSHTIEEQIGGQLGAGFRLTDVYGDTNGAGNLHAHNIPTFWATRAVKP